MTDTEFYNCQVGDYVTVDNQDSLMLEIGRIEEIIKQQNVFTYTLFSKPEETQCGRQHYQGKNEILKTTLSKEESIIYVGSKIEVMKITDYAKLSQEEKFIDNRFVCRQNYDPLEKKLTPEIETECVCNQIINPDDELFVCDCEKIYHSECILNENITCPCGNSISDMLETSHKKRKLSGDKSILLKKTNEEEFYELFSTALDEAATAPGNKKATPIKRGLNDKRSTPSLDKKSSKNTSASKESSAKKSKRKELLNIDDEAYQRVKNAIDNFSQVHQNKNMGPTEKTRYLTKEKYYKVLLYGIEEVKEKYKIPGAHLTEGEKMIGLKDQKENYQQAQDLALTLEATIWYATNKSQIGVDANYNMKNRELVNYLMDDNNYELRLSVLDGERKPEYLCNASENDLVPKKKVENIEKKKMQTLKFSKLPEHMKIISKSHKGETVIESEDNEVIEVDHNSNDAEPAFEDDYQALAEIVKKIDRNKRHMEVESNKQEDRNSLALNEDDEFGEFKLQKKYTAPQKVYDVEGNEDENYNGLDEYDIEGNKPLVHKLEDLLKIVDINGNKLIDQEVLKNAANVFFEKTYTNLFERLNHHLRADIANPIIDEMSKKYKAN